MAAANNGPGAAAAANNGPGAPLQRTTYTLDENISNIVIGRNGYGYGEKSVGSGRVVGFIIRLNNPIRARGHDLQYGRDDPPDYNYVVSSNEDININRISGTQVARMSGGKYKKSHKTRKNYSRRR